ncbi:MAG: flagellar hook capping FlgD N-terminal domain-containing protein [bacterium]
MPVSSVTSSSGSDPPASMITSRSAAMSEIDFLKMLITQLTHQDPFSPMEGTEFAAQLAQFSSLEELQKMSGYLDGSLQANLLLATSINSSMATTLIGKTVRAQTDTVELAETGDVSIQFLLDSSAAEVSVEIVDENGETVRQLSAADLDKGENAITWNGCDEEGHRLESGDYTIRVTAKDSSGQSVGVTPYFQGLVTGVLYRDGVAILLVGSRELTLGDIIAVYNENPERIPIG